MGLLCQAAALARRSRKVCRLPTTVRRDQRDRSEEGGRVKQGPRQSQLTELLEGTGLPGSHQAGALASQPPFTDRYGGTALATRWPHHIVEALDLRLRGAMDTPWATLAAVVPVPGEGEPLFIATTTAWRLDAGAARVRQIMKITDLDARHRRQLPTILAGDSTSPRRRRASAS